MYYIYYGGGGLIAALFYGLIAYGAAKLVVFLVPVFIALSGLLFLWSVAKNGIKTFLLKSIKALIIISILGILTFLCLWGSNKVQVHSDLIRILGYILEGVLIGFFVVHLCIRIYTADPVEGYDEWWPIILLIEVVLDIAIVIILPKIDALYMDEVESQLLACLVMVIPLSIVELIRRHSFTTIFMLNAIPFLTTIPFYYYTEGVIPSIKDEEVIVYIICAGISLIFSIIIGIINQIRIYRANKYGW